MIRATLIRSNRVSKPVSRLISTSVPKNTIGALQEFTEHAMVADGRWAGKINYDELEVMRKQLKIQQKERVELKHHLEDTYKKIKDLKHKVNDLQNIHQ